MQTIKYLILKMKTFLLSESPMIFPWWFMIYYFSGLSYILIIYVMILMNIYKG